MSISIFLLGKSENMKQLLQNYRTGEMELVECPIPKIYSNGIVVKTTKSLISVGTEKTLVDFGKASFIQKAKQQPDQVKQVINKINPIYRLSWLTHVYVT